MTSRLRTRHGSYPKTGRPGMNVPRHGKAVNMNQLVTTCPACDDRLEVTRLHCRNCDTAIEGHFTLGRLGNLSREQLEFVETFIRCEGKLSRMEGEVGLSYPTLRSRLSEVIEDMGFEVGDNSRQLNERQRQRVLEELEEGKISSEEAMGLLEAD